MIHGLIFDLDGTLADTLPVCFVAYRGAIEEFTGRDLSDAEIETLFGPSEEGIIRRAVPDRWRECLELHLEIYDREHSRCTGLFPGLEPILHLLRDRNVRLAIVTGKGPRSAEISLRHLGVRHLFDAVEVGSPEGGIKPVSIRRVLDRWQLPPGRVAYVGDAPYDMRAANEVGVVALGAAWAETADASALSPLEPAAVFTDVEAFKAWLDAHTAPRA